MAAPAITTHFTTLGCASAKFDTAVAALPM